MFGTQATWNAYQLSSFTPAERAASSATLALAWNVAAAIASSASGAVRGALGASGFTVNVLVLVACYLVGASLQFALFRRREPQGDLLAEAAWPTTAD
jgi:predicted MFS family arabinose efflux permease